LGGFSKFLGKCNAFIAELWGVLEGLRCAKRMGFTSVELHVDSLVVVNTITKGQDINSMGRNIVQRIRQLLQMEWEVKVQHSYREANNCADALANMGCRMGHGMMFYESCPTQISHLLAADQAGISFSRLIKM
jgi:ribonuclease HI